jgi:hypothetical protein
MSLRTPIRCLDPGAPETGSLVVSALTGGARAIKVSVPGDHTVRWDTSLRIPILKERFE